MDVGTLSLGGALSPITRVRRLFTAGEVGVWYDRSDFNGLSQDSAGTTAVTAATQPVGLMLDKSSGLVLGPELVTNGTFDVDTTGWTAFGTTPPTLSVVSQQLKITSNATGSAQGASATVSGLTAGKFYKLTISLNALTASSLIVKVGNAVNNAAQGSVTISSSGSASIIFNAPATSRVITLEIVSAVIGDYLIADNVSVKELPGYHATQATSTARPVCGANFIDLDGIDDSLTIPAGGGGSTGFFLCTAVRVDGGAGTNRVIYSDAGTNTGYILRLNASNQLELAAGNGTSYTLAPTTATLTAGPYVVTAWDDGTNLNVQVNGGAVDSVARPVVSAGNADFRIGKDYGAATGFFNGAVYSYVYVKNGQNVDDAARAAVKKYVAGNAGVSI